MPTRQYGSVHKCRRLSCRSPGAYEQHTQRAGSSEVDGNHEHDVKTSKWK